MRQSTQNAYNTAWHIKGMSQFLFLGDPKGASTEVCQELQESPSHPHNQYSNSAFVGEY